MMRYSFFIFSALLYATASAQTLEPIPAHSDFTDSKYFGQQLSANGERVAIGTFFGDAVYIYLRKPDGRWAREQRIPAEFQVGALDLDGDRLAVSEPFNIVGADVQVGRVHIYERGIQGWMLSSTINAPTTTNRPRFGSSLDLDGDRLLIGAPREPSSTFPTPPTIFPNGTAYSYVRNGSSWILESTITPTDGADGQRFGWRVRFAGPQQALISSRYSLGAANGRRGSLYVFNRTGSSWAQSQSLHAGPTNARFAEEFAVHGDLAAATSSVGIQLVQRSGNTWTLASTIALSPNSYVSAFFPIQMDASGLLWTEGTNTGARLRYANRILNTIGTPTELLPPGIAQASVVSADLTADTLFFGNGSAAFGISTNQGAAYAMARQTANFPVVKTFRSGNGNIGARNGAVVDIDGNRALITSPYEDATDGSVDSGAVRVFLRTGATWQLESKLEPSSPRALQAFGRSGILRGDFLVVGAPAFSNSMGRVYVYRRAGSMWAGICEINPSAAVSNALFGESLAFDGSTLVIRDTSGPQITLRTFNVSLGSCAESDGITRTLSVGTDFEFGRLMILDSGVLVALGSSETSSGDALITYIRGVTWGAPIELVKPPLPAGLVAGNFPNNFAMDANRLAVASYSYPTSNFNAGTATYYIWNRSGNSFTPIAPYVSSFFSSSVAVDGLRTVFNADSQEIGNGIAIFNTPGFTSPTYVVQPFIPFRGFTGGLDLFGTYAMYGRPSLDFPSNRGHGQVYFYDFLGGLRGGSNTIDLPPERVFADGMEEIP